MLDKNIYYEEYKENSSLSFRAINPRIGRGQNSAFVQNTVRKFWRYDKLSKRVECYERKKETAIVALYVPNLMNL